MRKAQFLFLLVLAAALFAGACRKDPAREAAAAAASSTIVTAADLKMRIAPNTTAVEIARLMRGEQVKIVQRSAEPVQVGKYNAHWYKVASSSGLTGWVYGAHLAIESDEGDARVAAEQIESKLRSAMLGRWEAARITGVLTTNFVTLMPDAQIEFGSGRKATQYGKYTIAMADGSAIVQVSDIARPMMTDLKARMVGETLVFTAMMNGSEYKLNLAEKDPELFKDSEKKRSQATTTGGAP